MCGGGAEWAATTPMAPCGGVEYGYTPIADSASSTSASTSPSFGWRPVSNLEYTNLSPTETSNRPPSEGTRTSCEMRNSYLANNLAARLAARGVYFQTAQYTMVRTGLVLVMALHLLLVN